MNGTAIAEFTLNLFGNEAHRRTLLSWSFVSLSIITYLSTDNQSVKPVIVLSSPVVTVLSDSSILHIIDVCVHYLPSTSALTKTSQLYIGVTNRGRRKLKIRLQASLNVDIISPFKCTRP